MLSFSFAAPAAAQNDTGKQLTPAGLQKAITDCTANKRPISCVVVSNHYLAIGPKGEHDTKRRQYLKIGCDAAAANGGATNELRIAGRGTCYRAGQVFLQGVGGPVDNAAAFTHFGRSCDFGNLTACAFNAEALKDGRGVAKDEKAAMALYRKACSETVAVACYQATRMVFFDALKKPADVATNPDYVFARKAAGTACQASWMAQGESCWYHGLYLEGGWGGAKDVPSALGSLEKACTLAPSPERCTTYAVSLTRGPAATRDPAKTKRLLQDACGAKYEYACNQLKRL
ncbi:hypothetical protein GRI41_12580 [Altererythrobacter aquaemixtae]|uniref:Beta-lactamase n=2 Tax=Pontixanthobacter aquaemixtae TaxID=1958940 RepID=A0A844ZUW5_9SPHN|nr:hypothetical protein [Pontixanthobacter aquaemixtae]